MIDENLEKVYPTKKEDHKHILIFMKIKKNVIVWPTCPTEQARIDELDLNEVEAPPLHRVQSRDPHNSGKDIRRWVQWKQNWNSVRTCILILWPQQSVCLCSHEMINIILYFFMKLAAKHFCNLIINMYMNKKHYI